MGIAVLGPLVVDPPARLGPRDRVVLAALAVTPGSDLRGEQLADALWGEHPPATWGKVVQGCIWRLRKILGPAAIETTQQGYRLALPVEAIDAHRFERLLGRARELLTLSEPERASYTVGEALALWRGRPFADLEDWDPGRAAARRLDELRRDAEELRLDAALRTGRSREVLGEAQLRVGEEPLRERRWALLALAQYQAGSQAEALRTLREVRTVLGTELGLDPGPDLVAMEQAILRQDPSLLAQAALPEPAGSCPYPGLLPYDIADTDTFFGRDAEVTSCLRRFHEAGVVVVTGASGSGKSSLIRAGVAAALRRDGRRLRLVSPGRRPMDTMAGAPGGDEILVVDQAEEVFTQCDDVAERARFLDALAGYAGSAGLVVAIRADRLGDVSAHPAFARVVERGLFLLGAMSAAGLRVAIEGPAHRDGLLLEPGLVDLLVQEVDGEPGALPLLAHALRETWTQREGRTLTVDGYRGTGGIRGAVARSAEEVYTQLAPDERPLVRDLLLRLVAPAADGDPARVRVPRRLVAVDTAHERVVERLVAARLVTSDEGVLEIAHEALIRAWPRLQEWLRDDEDGQRIRRHLTVSAETWDAMGRPDSELYRGVRLAQAVDWRASAQPDLTTTESDFLDTSDAEVDAELRRARRRAETEAAARRRTRRLAAGLAGVLVLALVAAAMATYFQRNAAAQATEADANRLAALSATVGSLDLSMLLAAEAARMADTPATRAGLLSTLLDHRRAIQVTPLTGRAANAALGAGGETMFVQQLDRVLAWSAGTQQDPHEVVRSYGPVAMAASPTADLLALENQTTDEPQVDLFRADGSRAGRIAGFEHLGGWPRALSFSADGRRLFVLVADWAADGPGWQGSVRELDLATGKVVRGFDVLASTADEVWIGGRFSEDRSSLAVWTIEPGGRSERVDLRDGTRTPLQAADSELEAEVVPLTDGAAAFRADGSLTVFDGRGEKRQEVQAHATSIEDVEVALDGTWAATADADGVVNLWRIDDAGRWRAQESLRGHTGAVSSIEVDPDGGSLYTASFDGTVIAWDVSRGAGFGATIADLGDRYVSNRPQAVVPGKLVVAPTRPGTPNPRGGSTQAGASVTAAFVNPSTGAVVDAVPVGRTDTSFAFGSSVSVSPDRSKVAITSGYATTVLDTVTRQVLGRVVLPPAVRGGPPEAVWCVEWSASGDRLLLGADGEFEDDRDGGIVVVNPATWEVVRRVPLEASAQAIERSPDGRHLAVASATVGTDPLAATVTILDARTYDVQRTLPLTGGNYPYDLSFSADGRWLAAGGDLGVLSVFDTRSWRTVHDPVRLHDELLQQVEWLPGGNTVVTSGSDGTVAVYDVESGVVRTRSMPASAEGEEGFTYLLSVTDQEITAITSGHPGRRYPLAVQRWLDYACTVAGRNLTADEWQRYLPDRERRRTCTDHP